VQSAKPPFKSQDLIFFMQTLYKQTNRKMENIPNCIIKEVNPAFCNAVCASLGNEEFKSKV